MKKNKIILILVSCFALTACQTVKDGLSGNKGDNSDEFLVKKKNPLIMPPRFTDLPKPQDSITEDEMKTLDKDDFDIQKMLGNEKKTTNVPTTQSGDAEEFVLRNIKNN